MKKLMVALSAVALAFGVHAAVEFPVGENFNDETDIPSTFTSTGECAISSTAYTFSKVGTVGKVNKWRDALPKENLAIKTPLTTPTYYNLSEPVDMPASGASEIPLYFDSLVKFTACDEDAVVPEGSNAKLMVWVKESETGDATNLMVTAGFLKKDVETPDVKIYNCGALSGYGVVDADDWCRLTIKAKADITNGGTIPGFVVFVNGNPVTIASEPEGNRYIGEPESAAFNLNRVDAIWNGNAQLFPSMIAAGTTISAVGFAGQGAVDDISFAATEPDLIDGEVQFALDPTPATVGLVIDGVEQPGVTTIAQAITAIGNISSPVDTVELTLFEGYNDAIEFAANENVGQLVLDLAGQTIEVGDTPVEEEYPLIAVSNAIPMLITDSSTEQTGKIVAGVGSLAVSATAALEIDAGTFDGLVNVEGGALISGGAFASDDSETFYLGGEDGYLAPGKTATYAEGYWTVADAPKKGWAIYLAEDTDGAFLIQDKGDLLDLATNLNKTADFATAGVTFKQMANIDLDGVAWAGIGAANNKDNLGAAATYIGKAFQGTYDGGNCTVTNITLSREDYIGFFGSLYGATVKNLKLSAKGTGFAATGIEKAGGDWSGALAVGVSVKSTIENVETLAGSFTTEKAGAGIVGYAAGGTVINGCINNLNVTSTKNEKAAGLVGCAQNTGSWDPATVTIDGCTNNGTVKAKDGTARAAGLVSYTDCGVIFKGTNVVKADVSIGPSGLSVININGGSATVEEGAVIKVPAGITTTQHNGKAHAGLNYATVDGSVATLVADSEAAKNGANLKVMTTGNTITLKKAGDSITLDTTLATATVTTDVKGYEVTNSGNVYTVTLIPVDGVTLDITALAMNVGDISNLVATVTPNTVLDPSVVWSVENAEPAGCVTVLNGAVTAVTAGTATVKATSNADSSKFATCAVTVTAAQQDWPTDPTDWNGKKASEQIPALKDTPLANADAGVIAKWAKGKGSVDFSAASSISTEAFLLNIDNASTPEEIQEAKDAFKITAITIAEDGTVTITGPDEADYNGKVTIEGKKTLDATWGPKADDDKFFRATLTVKEIAE